MCESCGHTFKRREYLKRQLQLDACKVIKRRHQIKPTPTTPMSVKDDLQLVPTTAQDLDSQSCNHKGSQGWELPSVPATIQDSDSQSCDQESNQRQAPPSDSQHRVQYRWSATFVVTTSASTTTSFTATTTTSISAGSITACVIL